MASTIRIKRSGTAGNPSTLGAGELAYSAADSASVSGGDRLYVGFGTETNGNAANHIVIGGEYFTSKLDHTLGTLTPDSAVLVDSNKKINEFFVDNLGFDGNTISSTDTNGNINIVPNGTGDVFVTADTTIVGDPNGDATITTNGTGDLTLSTNSGTNSGTIVIADGTDGNIDITPNGAGEVNISNVDIDGGSIDNVSIGGNIAISSLDVDNLNLDGNSITSTNVDGVVRIAPNGNGDFQVESDKFRLGSQDENVVFTTYGTGDLLIHTNGGVDSGSIFVPAGADQDVTVEPNGTGNVVLSADTTVVGDLDSLANVTTQGTGSLVINTNDGTDSGAITLNHGTNSDIVFEPNGTGRTVAHNLYVDDGSTNRSIQEFVEDITGGQIVGTPGVVDVTYDDGAGTTTIDLIETGVTTGSFGSQTKIPTFTVDADGRLTAAGEVDVATTLSLTGDNTTSTSVDLLNDTLDFTGVNALTVTANNDTVTVTADSATTTSRGVASFDTNNFTVSSGAVSAKDITLGSSTLTLGSTTSALAGLTQLDVDNIRVNGNTIFSTDTDGDIVLSPNATSSTTPGVVNVDDSRIINVNDPQNPKDAANKRYVDEVAQGLQALPAADLATTADLGSVTYDNGTSGVGATLTANANGAFPIIDGIQLEVGGNLLVKNQNDPLENGSYVLTQAGDSSNPWVLTRCSFCDEESEITGAFEFVTQGTQNGNTGYVATVPTDFLIGSSDPTSDPNGFTQRGDIIWVQFSGAGTFTAGTNLNLDGTEFNLNDNITIVDLTASGSNVEFTSTDNIVLDTGGNVISAPFTVSGGAVFENDTITAGTATFTDATDASSTTTGSVVVEGGVGVAKKLHVGDDIIGSGADTSLIDGFEIDGGTY